MTNGALSGKSALVTGGGTGIGAACAQALAADGAAVTICGRTESKLIAAIAEMSPGHGGSVTHVVADVTNEEQIAAAAAAAAATTGSLDGVVANAGGGGALGALHGQDVDEFRRVLDLNVTGTLLTLKHTVAHLAAAGNGSFVGMSSIAGSVSHLWFGAYPVAKAGIEHLIRNAADEYGPSGVRFNAIAPGFIETEIMEMLPRESDVYESYITNTPLGDVGQPADVGALARFLLGPESRWITGQVIAVDGGHSLRRGPDFTSFVGPSPTVDVTTPHRS